MMIYQYGYFVVSLTFLLIWLILFIINRPARTKMFLLSFLVMLAGPISEFWYLKDYWQPYYIFNLPIGGVEDLMFGFAIGGIAAVIFETFFLKVVCYCEAKKYHREWFFVVFILIIFISMIVLDNLLKLNSIFASAIGMIIAGLTIIISRRDLIPNAVFSGLLVALTMFAVYSIPLFLFPTTHIYLQKAWLLYNTNFGLLLFGHIPATEILWGFSWGFAWGAIYEFVAGARTYGLRFLT